MTPWAPADIETLRTLAAQKLSAEAIGNALGKSRNAVIGRARRSGIPLLHKQYEPSSSRRANRREAERLRMVEKRRVAKVSPRVLHDTRLRVAAAEPAGAPPPPVRQSLVGFTILHLRDGMCKFPFGDRAPYTFCGHPTELGESWCDFHAAIVFNPQQPKRLRAA